MLNVLYNLPNHGGFDRYFETVGTEDAFGAIDAIQSGGATHKFEVEWIVQVPGG